MRPASLSLAAVLALASVAPSIGCAGLETGNGEDAQVLVGFALTSSAPVDADGVEFPLATAQANVRRVDLYMPEGLTCRGLEGLLDGRKVDDSAPRTVVCSADGDHIRLNGPWVVDLLTGDTTPALPAVSVPVGVYRRVDVRFSPGDPDDRVVLPGSPLDDVTIAATGAAPAGVNASFYALRLRFDEEARFESVGVAVGAGALASAIALLDPAEWFTDLPLAACAKAGDLPTAGGVLQLADGDGECKDVEKLVRDAIEASGTLSDDD